MKARNDENLEGIQGLARGLDRLLPRGGARGEALRELDANQDYWQARALEAEEREGQAIRVYRREAITFKERAEAAERDRKVAERERNNAVFYEGRTAAKLAAVRRLCEDDPSALSAEIRGLLDGEGEK